MANGFVHKDVIKTLKNEFTKGFNAGIMDEGGQKRAVWMFPDDDMRHSIVKGQGNDEIKIIKTNFLIFNQKNNIVKDIMIEFIENIEGTLIIKVNGRSACSITKNEGLNTEFLKSLAYSIKREI